MSSKVTNKGRPRWQIGGSGSKRKDRIAEGRMHLEELERLLAKKYPMMAENQIQTPTAPTTPMDNTLMEQIQLSNGSGSKYPHFVGYFLQPLASQFNRPRHLLGRDDYPPKSRFVYASREGKELKEKVDVSLSFLGLEQVIIVGSSMGFLLCCANPETCMHYIVCNPITREYERLPEPQKPCAVANLAFLCKSEHNASTSLGRISYEVVRLGMSHRFNATTTLEVETYSSLTGEWSHSSVVSPSPVTLFRDEMPAFVVGEVMFWTDIRFKLLGYSPVRNCLQVWDLALKSGSYGRLLGLSEGRIHFARHDQQNLEMWVLEDYTRIGSLSGWVLKHRTSFTDIKEKNPGELVQPDIMGIMGFHPCNSQLILLSIGLMPYWYHSENGKMKAVDDFEPTDLLCNYICYEWPDNRSA